MSDIDQDEIPDDQQTPQIPPLGIYEGERNELKQRHGKGKNTFPNGEVYEGQYCNGVRHGDGKYTFKDGSVYTGQYLEGQRTGKGLIQYPDGTSYEGEFFNGKRNGHGTYKYSNGDSYTGSWESDLRSGQGSYTFSSTGIKKVGKWVEGKLEGQGEIVFKGYTVSGKFESSDKILAPVKVNFPSLGAGYSITWTEQSLIEPLNAQVSVDA